VQPRQLRAEAITYTEAITRLRPVREIWLNSLTPTLTLSVVLSELSIDLDFQLREQFAEAVGTEQAQLNLYTVDEWLPPAATLGECLLADRNRQQDPSA
jgi:hypothetical protein